MIPVPFSSGEISLTVEKWDKHRPSTVVFRCGVHAGRSQSLFRLPVFSSSKQPRGVSHD